tara:strand:- start:423 stop:1523 length:1101 start_codon:yes stop_codon:yes gene_type:complete
MSVLISSQDIYVSTQQSGSASAQGSDDGFNRFRIAMNSNPLTTGNNQYGRLSVTQFSAYRNFYYVNEWNNKIWLTYSHGGSNYGKIIELTKQDYTNIGDIAAEFSAKLIAAFAPQAANMTVKAGTQSPAAGYVKGQTGSGIFGVTLEKSGNHGITNVKLQCRQYLQDPNLTPPANVNQGPYGFNDSYALLGGKRIGSQDAAAESFTAVNGAADELIITGFFPLQRTTTQYLYMSCSENTSNMESQNISAAQPLSDTHIVSSSIIAKIPLNDTLIGFQQDQSTPFFVELDNRHISEILFEIKDHHGRTIDLIPDVATQGNMFSDMVFNWEVYSRGGNPHELQAPVKNYNIEQNTMAVNVRANTGDGF